MKIKIVLLWPESFFFYHNSSYYTPTALSVLMLKIRAAYQTHRLWRYNTKVKYVAGKKEIMNIKNVIYGGDDVC